MKKYLLIFLALFLHRQVSGQQLDFEKSFGNNGLAVFNGLRFWPKESLLVNNHYYFVSDNAIAKVHYTGALDAAFGTNGVLTLSVQEPPFPPNHEAFSISSFKLINGLFYVFGKVTKTSTSEEDIFIYKLNLNGVPDPGFAENGLLKVNFGAKESMTDLVVDDQGNLFCIGTKLTPTGTSTVSNLIYFKVQGNGTLQAGFDAAGYKQLAINSASEGAKIFYVNNQYLLTGTTTFYQSGTRYEDLLLAAVNAAGDLQSGFGEGGCKTARLEGGMSNNLKDIQLLDNSLYVNYFSAWSSSTQGSKIMRYNLTNDQTIFNQYANYLSKMQVLPEAIYLVEQARCSSTICNRSFRLSKLNHAGLKDAAFGTTGTFEYNFMFGNPYFMVDAPASVLFKDANGKILIGGFLSRAAPGGSGSEKGFALIRLEETEAVLGLPQPLGTEKMSVSPNPFTGSITITLEEPVEQIMLFSITGNRQFLATYSTVGKVINVPLGHLPSGIYILKVITKNNREITKRIARQ